MERLTGDTTMRRTDAEIKTAVRFYIRKQLRFSEEMDIAMLRHTLAIVERMSVQMPRLRRLCDELTAEGVLCCSIVKAKTPHFDLVRYGHGPKIVA